MVIFIALSSILSKPGKSGGSVKRDISEGGIHCWTAHNPLLGC